jgi:uncharacterized protein YbaA (DUF1428 family)|tara:strand:- start:87350 stop:87709 length:360 start_codon:yes stop_codon:yes gene_type:complete
MTYVQGFVLAVPADKKDVYRKMAEAAWPTFRDKGALTIQENWAVDVQKGKQTDFYRATDAKEGEEIVFSWISWPDRATCDAAAKAMEEEGMPEGMEMPFDGMRMFWGGFEPIFTGSRSG